MTALTITKENFTTEVENTTDTVLIDFWASWCGPCRMVLPIIDQLAQEVGPGYKVGKVNVDEQPELSAKYQVMSIPTLLVIKNGQVVESSVGFHSKEEILDMLKRA